MQTAKKLLAEYTATIKPDDIYFIKLGEKGKWEEECLFKNPSIRLGYHEIPHDLCMSGQWENVRKIYITPDKQDGQATHHKNQVQKFYTASENVMWITFYSGKLYWAFAESEVIVLEDKSKIRRVRGKWNCTSIHGDE